MVFDVISCSTHKKLTKKATEIRQKLDSLIALEKKFKNLKDWFEISEEGTDEWDILELDIDELKKELKEQRQERIEQGGKEHHEKH